MLVLSRKVGERIVIGENIVVTVTKVAGNRVAIGIEAPDEVRIARGELPALVSGEVDRPKKANELVRFLRQSEVAAAT